MALTQCEIAQWPGVEMRARRDPGLGLAAIDSMAWSLHLGEYGQAGEPEASGTKLCEVLAADA